MSYFFRFRQNATLQICLRLYIMCLSDTFFIVAQLCLTVCNLMDSSMPGLPVLHHLPEFAQVHVHCISDAVQPSHLLMPSSPSALNLSKHQGLFQ